MPPIRSARNRKPPPDGFDDLEDTLLEFGNKMKDAENASHEGKKRHEVLWPIFQISHQRSRYIYELYYEKEAISKPLYDWLLKNNYADANLTAKWKKQGYVASDAFKPRRRISTRHASVACPRRS
ncbi:G10 protein [Lobaria immixta]|nr:G10 protein [Lobaria immixta]